MSADENRLRRAALPAAFLLLAPLAYANVLDTFFLSDDFVTVSRVAAGRLSPVYAESSGGFFRPLFTLSFLLDQRLWGLRPLGFHLTNVALHALNAALVAALATVLARRAAPAGSVPSPAASAVPIPAAAGLIFLLHPSHTEAVTWAAGRADLLATLFSLVSLLLHARREAGRGGGAALAGSLASFALALSGKESAVCLPLAVFVLGSRWGGGGAGAGLARGAKSALPYACVAALFVAGRALALGSLVGGYGAGRHLDLRHSVVVSQLLRSTLRALLPAVVLQARFLESHALSVALLALGVALALSLAFALARARTRRALAARARRAPLFWTLAALFVVSLLPALTLRVDVYTTQGERYLYLPTVFTSIAVAAALARSRRRALAAAAAAGLLLFYAAALRQTNCLWREAAELSRSVVADLEAQTRGPGGAVVYVLNTPDTLRGVHLYRNGLAEAVALFAPAGQIAAIHTPAWHNLVTPHDRAELSAEPGGYALRLADPRSRFERVDPPPPCLRVVARSARELRFRLEGCPPEVRIFYLSGGRMIALAPAP